MLEYTKAAIKKTIDDFKRINYAREIITQVVYIAYLTYAIVYSFITKTKLIWVNAALFLLSVGYFAFFLYMTTRSPEKKVSERAKEIFNWCKRLLKLYTLGIMLFGLYQTTAHANPLSVILTTFMIVGWVLEVLFNVVFKFFIGRANLIIEGMEADYENITKPVRSVGNFFKKMTGQEVAEEKPKSKNRIFLDEKVAQAKQEKAEKKLAEKYLKKDKKIAAKMQKLEQKQLRRAEKKAGKIPPTEAETAVGESTESREN